MRGVICSLEVLGSGIARGVGFYSFLFGGASWLERMTQRFVQTSDCSAWLGHFKGDEPDLVHAGKAGTGGYVGSHGHDIFWGIGEHFGACRGQIGGELGITR